MIGETGVVGEELHNGGTLLVVVVFMGCKI
jgi:hypothetical protein